MSERIAEKLKKVPFLNEGRIAKVVSFVTNETVIAAALSVGTYVAKAGIGAAAAIPGIGGGLAAALRERQTLKVERALTARRMDSGATSEQSEDQQNSVMTELASGMLGVELGKETSKRQAEMETYMYEARPAADIIQELGGFYNEDGELNIMNREDLRKAIDAIGETKARITLSDRKGARLIAMADTSKGEGVESIEDMRTDLDFALAKLESDMAKLFENPVAKAMLDITAEENFDGMYKDSETIMAGMLNGEMDQQDKRFNKFMNKKAFWKGIQTGIFSAGGSLAVHFGEDVVQGLADSMHTGSAAAAAAGTHDGVRLAGYSQALSTPEVPTDLGGAPEVPHDLGGASAPEVPTNLGGNTTPDVPANLGGPQAPEVPTSLGGNQTPEVPTNLGGNAAPEVPTNLGGGTPEVPNDLGSNATHLSETAKMSLPDGYHTEVHDGHLSVTTPNGETLSELQLNKDGSLSDSAREALKSAGLNVSDHAELIQGQPDVHQQTVTAAEFVNHHQDQMVKIGHESHMNNNTVKADLNELKTQNHVDANGNIVISIKGMAAGGSFHGASGVNWHEAVKDGHLSAYLSASPGSQANAFEIHFNANFNANGEAVIPKGSDGAALFDAKGHFTGGFERISVNGGTNPDGSVNLVTLSTVVGSNQNHFTDTFSTPTYETAHSYVVTESQGVQNMANVTASPETLPPTVPLASRRNLGRRPPSPTGNNPGNGTGANPNPGPAANPRPNAGRGTYRIQFGPGGNRVNLGADPNATPNATFNPNPNATPNTGPNTNPNPNMNSNDPNTAGAANPNTNTPPPNPAEFHPDGTPKSEDEKYFYKLDNDKIEIPDGGYDFPGFNNFGVRERRQAIRFMEAAVNELGPKDKAAVVARAGELAQQALANASAGTASVFQEAVDIINKSAERINQQAQKEASEKAEDIAQSKALFDNLKDEPEGSYPYMDSLPQLLKNPDKFTSPAIKIASRAVRTAQETTRFDPDATPEAVKQETLRKARRIVLKAYNYADISPDLIGEVTDVLTQSMKPVKQEYRANPWEPSNRR